MNTIAATDFATARDQMVERYLVHRGIRSRLVLEAMRAVPRERFLPPDLEEFAYEDTPLPIAQGQTISQPYIVGMMIEALQLKGGEIVLEVGTGSGYAAAVLAQIAGEVYTVERIGQLAEKAASTLSSLGITNVHVLHGDGTLGWSAHAPYDAIVVAAGGPQVPETLKSQLKIGGRLVIPVGHDRRLQELLRLVRTGPNEHTSEELADVRFVPLLGAEGWATPSRPQRLPSDASLAAAVAECSEPFSSIESADLEPLLKRIGESRIVLLGEASHGTSEFYRMRDRISRALIMAKGFNFVAIEGDWPDAARIDHYVRHRQYPPSEWTAFARFPRWMWRNREVRQFVDWLREHNAHHRIANRVAFHGLDLYSMYTSIRAVLEYLDRVDPRSAQLARTRYACLTPWQSDPAVYGQAMLSGEYQSCEREVSLMLRDLLQKHQAYAEHDGERFLDVVQNARLIADAERYYRTMYYGSRSSWNLRDSHMFATLESLLEFHGATSRGIVWAHNSHVGDSAATEMSARDEYNIGHLCRRKFGRACYAIGFGTHRGTVAAASNWDEPMEVKVVRPSLAESYERLCHDSDVACFMLPLHPLAAALADLSQPRLQRAIGVIYRPESELQSHYFEAVLPSQFDEYIWFDETSAVHPIRTEELKGVRDTYPFGL